MRPLKKDAGVLPASSPAATRQVPHPQPKNEDRLLARRPEVISAPQHFAPCNTRFPCLLKGCGGSLSTSSSYPGPLTIAGPQHRGASQCLAPSHIPPPPRHFAPNAQPGSLGITKTLPRLRAPRVPPTHAQYLPRDFATSNPSLISTSLAILLHPLTTASTDSGASTVLLDSFSCVLALPVSTWPPAMSSVLVIPGAAYAWLVRAAWWTAAYQSSNPRCNCPPPFRHSILQRKAPSLLSSRSTTQQATLIVEAPPPPTPTPAQPGAESMTDMLAESEKTHP